MRKVVISFGLGVLVSGAVFTWLGVIPLPSVNSGAPYIRRATSHHPTSIQTVTIQPLIDHNPSGSTAMAAPYKATASQSAYGQTNFTNGTFSSSAPVSPTIYTPPAPAPPVANVRAPRIQEFALKLDTPQYFPAGGQQVPITLHDYGAETIGVRIGSLQFVRLRKQSNPDPHEASELTLIYQSGTTKAYHLNSPRAPIGCYLVRVVEP